MMRRASRPEREKVFMSSLVLVQNTLMIARFLSSTGSGGRSCRLSGSGRSIVGIYPSKYDYRSFQCPWVWNECLLSSWIVIRRINIGSQLFQMSPVSPTSVESHMNDKHHKQTVYKVNKHCKSNISNVTSVEISDQFLPWLRVTWTANSTGSWYSMLPLLNGRSKYCR